MNDKDYMKLALELAEKGAGRTAPNPMVGAVIVKDGKIIGQGWHQRYGGLHAERNALAHCTEPPVGAAMYVTLEPCCHYGKQPPCVNALIESGISRVVIGSDDPNPLVAGKGIKKLREHGISVETGVLKDECDRLNSVFLHYIQTKTPYVVMKYAMTMDGKIAAYTGDSRWVSGEASRKHSHELRNRLTAVMVGAGTVLADDPMLTCRIDGGRNPIRIICDTNLRTPLNANAVKTAKEIPTIIACCCNDEQKQIEYKKMGCKIINTDCFNGHVNLPALMKSLGEEGIDSILLEGGSALNWSALESGIVKKIYTYIAPKLIGGADAKTPVGGIGAAKMADAVKLKNSVVTRLSDDFLIESEV